MTAQERGDLMIEQYGEACTFAQASRMLNHTPFTIKQMLEDGRLNYACEGTRVDVRSVAEYIMAPKQIDRATRNRKKARRFAV